MSNETDSSGSPFYAALLNTLKSVFGTGLLALPWAFLQLQQSNMLSIAIGLATLLGAWSFYTMLLIFKCTVLAWPAGGYGELVTRALGGRGGMLCSANLVLHQVMCVAAYLVFIGDNLQDVLGGRAATYILASAVPVVLLCWLRDIRALGKYSAVGTTALLLALCLVLHEGCTTRAVPPHALGTTHHPPHPHARRMLRRSKPVDQQTIRGSKLWQGDWLAAASDIELEAAVASRRLVETSEASNHSSWAAALGSFVGISIFTFAGHGEVVPIVLSLGASHPRHAPYPKLVLLLSGIALPVFIGFSLAAMFCFGEETSQVTRLSQSACIFCNLQLATPH